MRSVGESLENAETVEDLANAVEAFYKVDYTTRRSLTLLWEENLRMLAGEQWSSFVDGDTGSWETYTPKQSHLNPVTQPRSNLLFPQVRALLSMLVKNLPRGTARGKDDDPSKLLARTAEALIEVLEEENDEDQKKVVWALWAIVCGIGWKKNSIKDCVSLDPPEILVDETGEPVLDPETQEPMEVPRVSDFVQMLSTTVLSPFEISVDPNATTLWDPEWIMETSVHSLEWFETTYRGLDDEGNLKEGYTGRAEDVQAESTLTSPLNVWNRLKSIGPMWFGGFSADSDLSDSAVLKVLYMKPCEEYRGGLEIHVANNIPLYVRGFEKNDRVPYLKAGRWHPYVPFSWFPQLGRFWPVSAIENGTSLQRRVNSIDALRALHRGTLVAPKLLLPQGSQINVDYISGVPGQIIEWNAAGAEHAPQIIQAGALSPDVNLERTDATGELKEILGTNDPLSGERAKGIPSFQGQAFIHERASDTHAVTHLSWEKSIEDDIEMQVQFTSKMIGDGNPRYLDLVRNKLKFSGIAIRELTLQNLSDSVIYRVEGGSSIPRSKVLHQQWLLDLVQRGLLDLSEPEALYDFLTLFGAERFHREGHELKKAQSENVMLLRGQDSSSFLVMFENHQLHIACHTKSLVDGWFTMGKAAQDAHMAHIMAHQQFLQQQAMAQGPPQPGQPQQQQGPPQGQGLTPPPGQALQ